MEDDDLEEVLFKLEVGNQEFIVVEHWLENQDFFFITDKGEQYHCKNSYFSSFEIKGLDYSTEETTILMPTKRYKQ